MNLQPKAQFSIESLNLGGVTEKRKTAQNALEILILAF